MHGYVRVEAAASLVYCTGVELGLFGEVRVGEVVSEVDDKRNDQQFVEIQIEPIVSLWA
jgi:hypothetical protein